MGSSGLQCYPHTENQNSSVGPVRAESRGLDQDARLRSKRTGFNIQFPNILPVKNNAFLFKKCAAQLKPVIDSVFRYDQTPEAYEKMNAGHTRGKIMVKM